LVEAWRKCAMDKAGAFLKSGEPAETIAKVALYECRDRRALAWEGMLQGGSPANVVLAAIEKIEADMRDMLVSLLRRRSASHDRSTQNSVSDGSRHHGAPDLRYPVHSPWFPFSARANWILCAAHSKMS
jgi:hypothetical protein